MIEAAIFAILTGGFELSGLVESRVFPVTIPQGTPHPAIAYTRISTGRDYSHDGYSGLADAVFQVTVWDPDVMKAKQVAEVVRAEMHSVSRTTVAGVYIGSVTCEDERDSYDEQGRLTGVQLDFRIIHNE